MSRASLRSLTACVVALTVLIVPGSALAAIKPGKSIGKVAVGQSESAVRSAVGKPTERNCYEQGSGKDRYTGCALSWKRLKLDLYLIDGRVAQIGTRSPREQTSRGIGVGDKRSALDKAYPGCKNRERAYCIIGRTKRTGDRYTFIALSGAGSSARIDRIAVGRWDTRFDCALGCG
jgi:hypothetical protein